MTATGMLTLAIPNFRGERYLEATLRSLSANRPHVRWWLQDAASDDRSIEIARGYATASDRIVSEPDRGQTDALNRAIPQMGGDIIGFINSDDLLAEGAAEAVLDHFNRHPEVDLVYGQVEWINAEGDVTGGHEGRIDSLEEILDIYNVWWNRRQWVQPEVFFRRSLWEKVGPFDTRYNLAFDYDFWVRCFLAGARTARLPRVLSRFRLHAAQKSTDALRAANEIRDIVNRHLHACPRPPAGLQRMLSYDRYHAGQDHAGRPLAGMLMRNPEWLLLPQVRTRLAHSLTSRLGGSRAPSA